MNMSQFKSFTSNNYQIHFSLNYKMKKKPLNDVEPVSISFQIHLVRAQDVSELPPAGQEEERADDFRVLHPRVEAVLNLGPRLRHHRRPLLPLHLRRAGCRTGNDHR